jgi:ubiquinone/menaquinone biosynthesis C-methylase UbiE
VLPRLLNKAMDTKVEREIRPRVCGGLHGQVVELGFGSGLNVPYYPTEVTKVYGVEPSDVSIRLAQPRITASPTPVEIGGPTGEHLDLPSGEFDAVLSTWTLCTIPNVDAALGEARRVLKPGGVLHFVEHGHAPDPDVARWQARLDPLEVRVMGGCHLNRRIDELIERAGFVIERLDTYYVKGAPKPWGYTFEGRARVN